MAKKSKENRETIILECTEAPGTSRYMTSKNKRNTPERLELKKYNPVLRKHTVHKEKK
ncbi:MAG TPA: 50S ribosomal protein L33 [Candidatus Hydrogenedentes bacterium]|jgi:large subunit ribosomal protein L33|nr:50S ribosomal protein L33 [Candidatus Hydrogenedentota bacterium]HOJ68389.1 50S ribosomal protein L33 [Candidatus Hydrogenedentota bacterium]HOK90872.1 50S ribosomal protein L33 [Candidatus Hydrogenedentota bacterium]HOQ90208.1 50S ribosomal protein L33 [Candidatus Hydrogenedentota bacterium]HOV61949.1 50S ribosomal protein L33 [Candidatus Hydrogenedentota bacterium]